MNNKERKTSASGHSAQHGALLRLTDFMQRAPVTVTPDTSIGATLDVMAENRIGSVIVTEAASGRPVGIFTLRDVLCRIAIPQVDVEAPIESVMTRDPIAVPSSLTVAQAAHEMGKLGLRHLLVTGDDGGLAGIVSRTDVYNWMCDSCASIRREKSKSARTVGRRQPATAVHDIKAVQLRSL